MLDENFQKFKSALSSNVVRFSFKKKDGSERNAFGTTSGSCIPDDRRPVLKEPKLDESGNVVPHKIYKLSDAVCRYYDLEKCNWRSFLIGNLLEWEISSTEGLPPKFSR